MTDRVVLTLVSVAFGLSCTSASAASPADDLAAIKAVGSEGKGAPAAAAALKRLAAAEPSSLPAILAAFDDANPLATNYLRSAVESIADRAVKSNAPLPVKELTSFVQDRERNPRARSLAFEWLQKVDEKGAATLVSRMIDDPSPELRRIAVQRLIDLAAKATEEADIVQLNEQALAGAVDDDQVKAIVEKLKKHGKTVDLPRHFGFLTKWFIIGPFDNVGLKGFAAEYPPEKGVDLRAKYPGQMGDVEWTELGTEDDYGILDIAKDIKPYKGAVMYLATEFVADKPRAVDLRLGTPNAWKLWLNGKPLFSREEYHRGMALDQYRARGELKAGRNVILVKLCQNEQKEEWAQRYQLQLRVCDAAGSAIHPAATTSSKLSKP